MGCCVVLCRVVLCRVVSCRVVQPFFLASLRVVCRFCFKFSSDVPWISRSSTCLVRKSPRPEKNSSVTWQKWSPLLDNPCGDLVKQNRPNSHMNVVSSWDSLASFDWKYPFTKSKMATCVVFVFIEFITCSDDGNPWTGRITNLFRAVKSTTNRNFPLSLGTNCEGAQYLLDSSTPTLLIMPCFKSLSISVRAFFLMLAGMGRGLCMYSRLFHISRV